MISRMDAVVCLAEVKMNGSATTVTKEAAVADEASHWVVAEGRGTNKIPTVEN